MFDSSVSDLIQNKIKKNKNCRKNENKMDKQGFFRVKLLLLLYNRRMKGEGWRVKD